MRFTPKEDIRWERTVFEEGNTYSSEKQGVPDESVERWYAMGLAEIEGRDPSGPRQTSGGALQPQSALHP